MEILESEFVRQSVKRGAALMDENDPRWFEKINLESLDMKNPCLCVLGQVYGRYGSGLKEILSDGEYADWISLASEGSDTNLISKPEFYGFCFDRDFESLDYILDRYRKLDNLWTQEIKDRYERGVNIDG